MTMKWSPLFLHLWILTVSGVLFTITYAEPDPSANIGAGMAGGLFAILGLPWSLLFVIDFFAERPDRFMDTFFITCALLNAAIHATVTDLLAHRAASRGAP
jgi:hypothetical protein